MKALAALALIIYSQATLALGYTEANELMKQGKWVTLGGQYAYFKPSIACMASQLPPGYVLEPHTAPWRLDMVNKRMTVDNGLGVKAFESDKWREVVP